MIQESLDLNKADSLELQEVYGVGKKLSARIIRFREALGGFVSMDQLYEVYSLDSAVIERLRERYILAEEFQPRTIDLNTDSLEYLAKHPYISFREAKLIIAYREQHGNYTDPRTLLNIPLIDEDKLTKLVPYLRTESE